MGFKPDGQSAQAGMEVRKAYNFSAWMPATLFKIFSLLLFQRVLSMSSGAATFCWDLFPPTGWLVWDGGSALINRTANWLGPHHRARRGF